MADLISLPALPFETISMAGKMEKIEHSVESGQGSPEVSRPEAVGDFSFRGAGTDDPGGTAGA